MNFQDLLITSYQLILITGIGGVLIVSYATKDVFVKEEYRREDGPRFIDDYQELMWLAEGQKGHPSVGETRRFYWLRYGWPEMHSYIAAK